MKIIFFTSNRSDIGLFKNLLNVFKNKNRVLLINFGDISNIKELNSIKNISIKSIFQNSNNNSLTDITINSQKQILKLLLKFNPDINFIPGDRIEMISPAIWCHLLGLKIAHLHGGEVTFGSKDDTTRHAISKLSHLHYVSNLIYKKRLIQMGEDKNNIINCGSVSICQLNKGKFISKHLLEYEYNFKFKNFNSLISYHPSIDFEKDLYSLENVFKLIKNNKNDFFIFTSPNPDEGSRQIHKLIKDNIKKFKNILYVKSFGNNKFLSMLKYVNCIIGNSSSGIIEAPSLLTFSINIGDRQKGRLTSNSVYNSKGSYKSITDKYNLIKRQSLKKNKFYNPYFNKNTLKIIKNSINKIDNIPVNKIFHDR